MPFITLASPTDTVVLMGDDPYATGYTYRNDTLTSWYGFAGADAPKDKRPNAHGSFGYDRLYANEGTIVIKGSFWGASPLEAAAARNRLTGLFADGLPVTMTVSDELGVSSRQLNVVEAEVPWLPYPNFDFELTTTVPDPRRYGPSVTQTTGAPVASSGLTWPLGSGTKGTRYAWTGAQGASSSTESVNGALQRTNLSRNPQFAFDTNDWFLSWNGQSSAQSVRDATTPGPISGYSLKVTPTGNGTGVEWQPPVATGVPVFLSVYVKGGAGLGLVMYGGPNGVSMIASGTPVNGWQRYVSPTAVSTANNYFYVDIFGNAGVPFWIANTMADNGSTLGTYFDGSSPSSGVGSYWDWGTVGASGQLVFRNAGNASSAPSFRVYGAAFTGGFRITEVETGRELTYGQATAVTDVLYLNGRYRTVSLNAGGNYLQRLTKRQWFTVPPRTTRTYQFTPLGGYTGTPYLDIIAARADL